MSSSPTSNVTAPFVPTGFYSLAFWMFDRSRRDSIHPMVASAIINRAYYAALLSASAFTNVSTRGKQGHVDVVKAMKRKNPQVGNTLDELRLWRQDADYGSSVIPSKRPGQAIKKAHSVLKYFGIVDKCFDPDCKPYTSDFLDCASQQPQVSDSEQDEGENKESP